MRTPIGRYGGALAGVRPDDLAALVVREAVDRAGVPDDAVDEVVLGAANQAGEDNRNVARMAALLAGLPVSTPGYTVNRLCASGLQAVVAAAQTIRAGEADLVVAGGVESMTRAPWVMAKPGTPWARPGEVSDTSLGWRFINPRMKRARRAARRRSRWARPPRRSRRSTGSAGRTPTRYALRSQERAVAAAKDGRFDAELIAVETPAGTVTADEGPRPDTSLERLATLKTVFRDGGVVTAGSSSPLSDGAAALSSRAVTRWRVMASPRSRASSPAPALVSGPRRWGWVRCPPPRRRWPARAGPLDDVGSVELNEAFAVQVLACARRLGLDLDRVNADGGAIALGHPLGCSGARLVVTLLGRMQREGSDRGLATLCVGVGQGLAMLVERV